MRDELRVRGRVAKLPGNPRDGVDDVLFVGHGSQRNASSTGTPACARQVSGANPAAVRAAVKNSALDAASEKARRRSGCGGIVSFGRICTDAAC